MAYVTVDDVYERGNFDSNEQTAAQATKLTNLIVSAQAMIESYTRNTFEVSGDTTRKFDAVEDVDGQTLYFGGRHGLAWCKSITTVTNGDGSTIASSNYVTEPRHTSPYYGITLKSAVSWTYNTDDAIDAIEITGRWGYSVTPPEDIQEACILLVLHWYRMSDQAEEKMIPDDICMMLKHYRSLS